MKRPSKLQILFYLTILALFSCKKENENTRVLLTPEPAELILGDGQKFRIADNETIFISDSGALPAARHLNAILGQSFRTDIGREVSDERIILKIDDVLSHLTPEGYSLKIDEERLLLGSSGPAGLVYGIETLRQLMFQNNKEGAKRFLPPVEIIDQPRFKWRGLHLDVSRHFMPVDFIKKFIDQLAAHKLNTFHWHLVDGIGWRMEIKSHPELTEWGAWRIVKEGRMPWQDYETWKPGDSRPKYGGFYTQNEIRDVIAYARDRFVTVIPEIELPGHSQVVFDCYPELICTDEKGAPLTNTGVYCAANPGSYELLEDVLTEVIGLFPSEYIHIGGDEVGKGNWTKCSKCRKLMSENEYTAHEVQSHFVNHFDKFIKEKGRKLIGWHEIMEGALSPSATIMYWGGAGGISEYARRGHEMVLSPGSHLYFDHYQSLSRWEPKAWGGYSNLREVYEFEPVPQDLESEFIENILGIQANTWTEYMPAPENVEYMVFPRIAALSEVAWSVDTKKNWRKFREKMGPMIALYETMGINYAKSGYRPQISFALDTVSKNVSVDIETELISDIYYTTDGSDPAPGSSSEYSGPFTLEESATVKAISSIDQVQLVEIETMDAVLHSARGSKVHLKSEGYGNYKAKGGFTLVDTEFGGDKWGNGQWLGILNDDLEAVVEFDTPIEVSKVGLSCIEETGAGIYFPKKIEVLASQDGKTFSALKSIQNERQLPIPKTPEIRTKVFQLDFDPVSCKFLRIHAEYQEVEGQGVFIFSDEVIIF